MRRILPALLALAAAATVAAPAAAAAPTCAGGKTGTPQRDVIAGGTGADRIRALGGDDFVRGEPDLDFSRARDCLNGGPGRDHLIGGDGADVLVGGPGADVIYGEYDFSTALSDGYADHVWGGPGDDRIYPAAGANVTDAGPGNDFVDAANGVAETVRCGPGRDKVSADFSDRLLGCERVRRLLSPLGRMLPARGGGATEFSVRWRTLSAVSTSDPGGEGYGSTGDEDFTATVKPFRGRRCRDAGSTDHLARNFRANATVTMSLRAPRGGWCPGVHRVYVHHSYVEDVTEPEPDSCDTPESGSSQCESSPTETEDHDELLWKLTFRVGG